jgi:hypothetical protein
VGMWVAVICVPPALWTAATKASLEGARPSSEVMTRMGRVVSFGARLGTFQSVALVMRSCARLSGVHPASGEMPSAARFVARG